MCRVLHGVPAHCVVLHVLCCSGLLYATTTDVLPAVCVCVCVKFLFTVTPVSERTLPTFLLMA